MTLPLAGCVTKMFCKFLGLVGVVIAVFGSAAQADGGPEWTCTPEQFVGDAGFDGSLFKATMRVDCLIRGATGAGLQSLERHFVWGATKAPGVSVHAGPMSYSYSGLPGSRFDITARNREADGSIVEMREDVYIATDYRSRLFYFFNTKDIRATGDAERMKFLGVNMEFRPAGEHGSYRVIFQNTIHLDLPIYVRPAAFVVRNRCKTAFQRKVKEVIPTLMHKL